MVCTGEGAGAVGLGAPAGAGATRGARGPAGAGCEEAGCDDGGALAPPAGGGADVCARAVAEVRSVAAIPAVTAKKRLRKHTSISGRGFYHFWPGA
jgi:hypothetical protein